VALCGGASIDPMMRVRKFHVQRSSTVQGGGKRGVTDGSYFSARAVATAFVADDRHAASAARRAGLRIRRRNWDRHGRQQFGCRYTARIFGRRS
jgi:hypothetical protein